MTSPSVSQTGQPPSAPLGDPEPDRSGDDAPSDAVTLADLIAEAGPLPADAALECVQRLAERLTLTPRASCAALGPADVLIDDDGGIWLNSTADVTPHGSGNAPPQGMDRLGRLLAFLATGNGHHLSDGIATADLPVPLSTVAGRLFSHNGACYQSYAELAVDAATLRGVAIPVFPAPSIEIETPSPVLATETPAPAPEVIEPVDEVPAPIVETPEPIVETPDPPVAEALTPNSEAVPARQSAPEPDEPSSGGLLGIGMIAAAAVGAVAAYLLWQAL